MSDVQSFHAQWAWRGGDSAVANVRFTVSQGVITSVADGVAAQANDVSIHHGGGVGIGRSIHAGMVCVADGTDLAAQKLSRVLLADPGMGVIRHADAGYERAIDVAKERGVRIPMLEQ